MAEIKKRKTRMYEPWGYVDENNYQGAGIILDNDLESFFAEVSYNKDDNKIHFANKDGEEKATLDVAEFVKSDSIVERAWYEDGKIYIKFTNGDVITIDVEELIDQNEFADGLQVNEGIVSVLIDGESEAFLSVSSNGVKVSGVQDAIDAERDRAISAETALDEKIDQEIEDRIADVNEEETRAISAETALDEKIGNEIARATSAETALDQKIDAETARAEAAEEALDEKIDQEIANRIADVDEEETRATSEETRIEGKLDDEIQRAKDAEHALDVRIDTLNDAITNEKTRATAAEQELSTRLTTEIQERKDDVDAEEARATSAETALNAKIDQEIADRINAVENEKEAREAADNRLQEAITSEVSRATSAETQLNNKIDQEIANREADVDAEEARAEAAEEALDAKIDAEEARAISAETALNNKIEAEIADRKAEAIASAEYVKDDVKIYFKNNNGETLSTIDASDFIADGMIENVQLVESGSTSVLVITWNTDGGSKVTRLDVGDIFEADNYYTKIEVDDIKEALQDEIDAEEIRATSAETDLNTAIAAEITRAEGAEGDLQDAIDAETARATSAETDLNTAIAEEASTARAAEQANASAITTEKTRAEGAESNLQSAIADEATTARAAEQANATAIAAEQTRAEEAEALKANAADVYTKSEVDGKETALQASINSNTAAIAAEEARAEDAEQVLQDNIDAEETRAKAAEAKKVDRQVNGTNGKALIFNETDGGGAKFENTDGINSFVGVNDAGASGIDAQIYAINKDTKEGSRIDVSNTGVYYTVGSDAPASRMVADNEIATKGNVNEAVSGKADAETVYTKEDVDALLLAKENEIYNLTKIVGDMGGAVTYNLPNEAGKSFNTLMNNNGTVKLTDDVTTGRFGPGITAKNKVKLNLNNNDLTVTGLTITSAQGAIMARGTQEITIYGKGTIDAGNGICVEGNGADSVINLTGSTTVYQTDRSGGELIYCYTGTINITNGTFKNNGEDKKFLLNCYDANYRAGTAKIVVTGGKFYDFNPADNGAEGEHTSFVPEGYHVETSIDGESTVYTVKKDA